MASTGASESLSPGTKLNIICWLLVALAAIFVALRVYCKFRTHRSLWWDDHILILAWITMGIATALTSFGITLGLTKHVYDVDPTNFSMIGLMVNVNGTFAILAAVLSKTSFAVTLLRITEGPAKACVWFVIVVMNVSMNISALLFWVKCNPPVKTWKPETPGTCMDESAVIAYTIYASAISAVMDLALSILPWRIIWALQMRKTEKFGVALAMSMGIFAAITAAVKCTKIPTLADGDFTYVSSELVIWATAELATTIIGACIPVLRVLIRDARSSAKKYYRTDDNTGAPYTGALKTSASMATGAKGAGLKSQVRRDEDTGSDKSILERAGAEPRGIIQTNEFTVTYHEEGASVGNSDLEAAGYEMENWEHRTS